MDDILQTVTTFETDPKNKIQVRTNNTNLHPLVKHTSKTLRPLIKEHGHSAQFIFTDKYRGALETTVTPQSFPRALLLWDALLRAFRKRHIHLSVRPYDRRLDRVYISLLEEELRISIRESVYKSSKLMRIVVSPEHIGRGDITFKDSPEEPLEEQLNKLIIELHRKVIGYKEEERRQEKHRQERWQKEMVQERLQQQERNRVKKEELRLRTALTWAQDHETCVKLERFISTLKATINKSPQSFHPSSEIHQIIRVSEEYIKQNNPLLRHIYEVDKE